MTLQELSDRADVTPRTVRYYIAQGLLPPAEGAGPGASYTDEHLRRLQAIKVFQAQYLPLAEIRQRLSSADDPAAQPAAPAAVPAAEPAAIPVTPESRRALDYLSGILGARPALLQAPQAQAPHIQPAPVKPPEAPAPQHASPLRSTWERHALSPDVEIHIQRPLSRESNRKVEQLLESARQIFSQSHNKELP